MEEEIEFLIDSTKENMHKTVQHLEKALLKIRAGRANPAMLDSVRVDYYGSSSPLGNIANISTPDARTLMVQPWEKNMISEIEKAILNSGLGFNPGNNGDAVIINIPALTEERRRDLVKMARAEAEESRIGIRNSRKEANDELKKMEKDGLAEDMAKDLEKTIQDLTNSYIAKVDQHLAAKEEDIMKV